MSDIILLDGGLGQELVHRSGKAATPLWSISVMIEAPELVRDLHRDFYAAGATVATTNTYMLHADRLIGTGYEDQRNHMISQALESVSAARKAHGSGRIAGSVGPLFASYRPDLCPPPAVSAPLYADLAERLAPHVDFLIFETVASVDHAEGALSGASGTGKPVWLSLTVDDTDGRKLRSGEPLAAVADVVARHRPEAVLVNCSVPEVIGDALSIIAGFGRPYGAYANGFAGITEDFKKDRPTVAALQSREDLGPDAYAEFAMAWVAQGATIIGGCCEIGPAHIAEIARRLRAAGHDII